MANDFCAPRRVTEFRGVQRRLIERRLEAEAGGVIAGEAANEGVAGAGRVDRPHLDRRDALDALLRRQERAAGAEGHDHGLVSLAQQALGGESDLVLALDLEARQNGELGLVRRNEAREPDHCGSSVLSAGAGFSTVLTP